MVEIDPGVSAENVRNPTPVNSVSERVKFVVTKEATVTGIVSASPALQLGGKLGAQEERFWQPIKWKYHENPGHENLSALWEFCVMDKTDGFELDHPLLPGVEFLVSRDTCEAVSFIIACYYHQQPMISRAWKGGRKVVLRDFCHETRIIMPVVDWPNHERLHRLNLPITGPTEISPYIVDDYQLAMHDAQKLIFRTSAECKAFVPRRGGMACDGNLGSHSRGPKASSM